MANHPIEVYVNACDIFGKKTGRCCSDRRIHRMMQGPLRLAICNLGDQMWYLTLSDTLYILDGSEITITIDQKVRLMVEVIFKVLALYLFLFAVRLLIPTFNQFLIYFILVLLESIDFRFINLRKVLFWNKFEIGNLFTFRSLTKKLKISPRTGFRVEKWWKKFYIARNRLGEQWFQAETKPYLLSLVYFI